MVEPGSPPHTRERPLKHSWTNRKHGITPAYAGKTLHQCLPTSLTRDHPRIRGKDYKSLLHFIMRWGSPPHTRERLLRCVCVLCSIRITPAYAGKTLVSVCFQLLPRDHPRIRGKDFHTVLITDLIPGSPPHTRERHGRPYDNTDAIGITPAYAGKTLLRIFEVLLLWDHPRIRGKDARVTSYSESCTGSPPHTRERHINTVHSLFLLRITPAYAGKTESPTLFLMIG